jgi:hypothetical protein
MLARIWPCLLAVALCTPAHANRPKKVRRLAMVSHRLGAPATLTTPPPEPVVLTAPAPPTAPGLRFDAPPQRSDRPQRRWGLFAGGMTLLLMGYGTDIGLSYGLGVERSALSLIPVFGPLAQMGSSYQVVAPSTTGNPSIDGPANERIDSVNHAVQTGAYVVLSIDAALQLAGAVMAIFGALPPRGAGAERAPVGTGRVALGGPGRAGLTVTF